jgi:trimethylamine--corrinoid protein Co-methyltransferase
VDESPASNPRPALGELEPADVDAIHEASLHIIEHIGIQLKHDHSQDVLRAHGASVDDDGVVRIPRDVVESCLECAPASFTLHARNPDRSVQVGGDGDPVRAPGYGPSVIRSHDAGRRDATLADYADLVRLAHVEDVISCVGFNVCEPTDVDHADRRAAMLKQSLLLSDKPVMGSTQSAAAARTSLDLVRIAMDDPDLEDPSVAGLINTVPPRGISTDMLGALVVYATAGQPLIVSSFTMAGASGPSELAASMAQTNAENLTGITLAQLVNPGTPVVYGVPSSNIDAQHGTLTIGTPESALFVSFAGQMGRYYDIPARAGGGLTDGKTVDFQSGTESTFLQFVTAASGIDFVLNAAGILEAYAAVSPEKFVLDCETLRHLDRLRAGVTVDADGFPFDRMAERGPAGHFLDDRDTTGAHAGAAGDSMDKRSFDAWNDDGARTAFDAAHEVVDRRLDDYDRPPMDSRIERRLEAFVARERE